MALIRLQIDLATLMTLGKVLQAQIRPETVANVRNLLAQHELHRQPAGLDLLNSRVNRPIK
ncbi:MAG: hypothetical protein KDJ99_30365 [Candidatus Competibacteraceae bacterium]|nr:hypothetical protein [Candidatus Competibacteraceae bacterium]